MKIRQRHDIRQRQILDAVARIITTGGMDKVTIKDIAEDVGVTEGAIYRHFVSKREIFSFVVYQWGKSLLDTIVDGHEDADPPLESLERVFRAQLSDAENHQALSYIAIVEAIAFEGLGLGAQVASIFTRYLEGIRQILEQGVQSGAFRPDLNLDAAATTFFGLIQSTATLWALNGYASPLAERATDMWEIYAKGISTV